MTLFGVFHMCDLGVSFTFHFSKYRGSPASTVSTSTISTSTNFFAIGIKSVLVESEWDCYVVKLVLVEIGYVYSTH